MNTRLTNAKATMEQHKIRDVPHLMQFLGHRSIKTTLLNTQLMAFVDDDYASKAVDNVDQIEQLIESGFDCITDIDETKPKKRSCPQFAQIGQQSRLD